MTFPELLEELYTRKISVSEDNGELSVSAPPGSMTGELLTTIKLYKLELLSMLSVSITKAPPMDAYPLTFDQKRFWILSQFEESSAAYNIPLSVRLKGKICIKTLEAALQMLVERQEILRTIFREDSFRNIVQVIEKNCSTQEIIYKKIASHEDAIAFVEHFNASEFDLSKLPLVKVAVVEMTEGEYLLSVVMHHIIADRWSLDIFITELTQIYHGLLKQKEIILPALSLNFKDYAYWLNNQINNNVFSRSEQYWINRFSSEAVEISLPFSKKRPFHKTYNGNSQVIVFSEDLHSKIKHFSRTNGITSFSILMAAVKGLLYKYTGNKDITLGIPVSSRNKFETKNLMGLFLNSLPIRTIINDSETFSSLLTKENDVITEAFEHQMYPFDLLVEKLHVRRDPGRMPLFDVMVSIDSGSERTAEGEADLELYPLITQTKFCKFDLVFQFLEANDVFQLHLEYNTDLFDCFYIQQLLQNLASFMDNALNEPHKIIEAVEYLTPSEKDEVLNNFNNTDIDYPSDKTIIDLIGEQVAAAPLRQAIQFNERGIDPLTGKRTLTEHVLNYKEVDILSNKVANFLLKAYQIEPGDLISVTLDKTEWLIPILLGILKAGGVYLPIDMDYPQQRIDYLRDFADSKITIGKDTLEHIKGELQSLSETDPRLKILPDDLVHIMFTSGSTGNPKGVMISHRNIAGLIKPCRYMELDSAVILLSTVSMSFDTTNIEFWGALANGAKIILETKDFLLNYSNLKICLRENQVNTMWLTTSWFENAVENDIEIFSHLKQFITGGDVVSQKHVNMLKQAYPKLKLLNGYGPTEDTTFSTIYRIDHLVEDVLPIGKPIDNGKCYVLNDYLIPQPIGIAGTLYVGGAGVSKGYYKNEGLTAEKFIDNPFTAGTKLYNTGDMVKWMPDGNLHFIGRKDKLKKIRGKFIDTTEIENCLNTLVKISQSVVVIDELDGERSITAYIVLVDQTDIDPAHIIKGLKEKLPLFMIPSRFIEVPYLPLSPNGKTDFAMLPKIGKYLTGGIEELIGPRTENERRLVEIWKDVLSLEELGIKDNFFEIGGHSLKAIQVISRVRETFSITITVADFFANQTIEELALVLEAVPVITDDRPERAGAYPTFIPLSFAQERLWFIDKLEGSVHYHVPLLIGFKGELDVNALEAGFNEIINRHEVLRTVFRENNGLPYQHILDNGFWKLSIVNEDNPSAIEDLIKQNAEKPFDLAEDCLIRGLLIKKSQKYYIFSLVMHHIITDGWSSPIFIKELTALYHALVNGQAAALPVLPIQYADFAIWQKKRFDGGKLSSKLEYWKNKLSGIESVQIPTDFPRAHLKKNSGKHIIHEIDRGEIELINLYCREEKVTLFMLLLSALKLAVHKITGQDDICIGTAVANRDEIAIEPLIGFFVNSLPIRSRVGRDASMHDLLLEVKQNTLEAFSNQEVPFEKIVEEVVSERDLNKAPLFQILLVLQNNGQAEDAAVRDLEVELLPSEITSSKLDITFNVQERTTGLFLTVCYNPSLYMEATVRRLTEQFGIALGLFATSPDTPLKDIILIDKADVELIQQNSRSQVSYEREETIADLLKKSYRDCSEKLAVKHNSSTVSYSELGERSKNLGLYLKSIGIGPGTLVGICTSRSIDAIVAICAVLESGGTFVPIDAAYPPERINYILEDTNAAYLIVNIVTEGLKAKVDVAHIIEIGPDASYSFDSAGQEEGSLPSGEDLLMVLYTSGSTGHPKGVMLQHYSMMDHLYGLLDTVDLSSCDSFLLTSSFSADGGYSLIFASLLLGKALHIVDEELLLDGVALRNYILANRIDCIKTVPSLWLSHAQNQNYMIPDKVLILGGEVLPTTILKYLREEGFKGTLFNNYGPTETTIGKLMHRVDIGFDYPVIPIGKPISNTRLYIVDNYGKLCGVGMAGELLIGGDGVAKGYLNKEKLTEDKFIPNTFDEAEGKLYRTGDMVKWLNSGDIEFIGRNDDQIKIRGHRVELGEIENTLLAFEGVQQACVLAAKEEDLKIYAFYVSSSVDADIVRGFLGERLPFHMVPSVIRKVEKIPFTTSGKVDKYKLLSLKFEAEDGQVHFNETEEKVAFVFADVLSIEKVNKHNSFFEMGGHSLKAVQAVSILSSIFGNKALRVKDLFVNSSVLTLSRFIDALPATGGNTLTIGLRKEEERIPLSYAQERLWVLDKIQGTANYHIPLVLKMKKGIDYKLIEKSMRTLLDRHEILRTNLYEENQSIYQKINTSEGFTLPLENLNGKPIGEALQNFISRPFDLYADYLIRSIVYQDNDKPEVLVIVLHHIVTDGWSMPIFVNELIHIYECLADNFAPSLSRLSIQYADYAAWQRKYLDEDALEKKLVFWKAYLLNVTNFDFPTDYPRSLIPNVAGAVKTFSFDETLISNVRELAGKNQATLFVAMLSAFKVLLYKYTGQLDICIGTPTANRNFKELEGLIGFFINTIPVRSSINKDASFTGFLEHVRLSVMEAMDNGDVPFEKIVDAVISERTVNKNPLYQTVFHFQSNQRSDFSMMEKYIDAELPTYADAAKFDLTFHLSESGGALGLAIEYSTALFCGDTIDNLFMCYRQILEEIVNDPGRAIKDIEMLGEDMQEALISTTQVSNAYSGNTVLDLFYERVNLVPHHIAGFFQGTEISYQLLEDRSNQLANAIIEKVTQRQVPIALFMDKGIDYLVSMLAVWKSGNCFVPFNPSFPIERNKEIWTAMESPLVITTAAHQSDSAFLELFGNVLNICVDTDMDSDNSRPQITVLPEMLSYIIFTSGSTGKPKGAMVEHRGMLNHLLAKIEDFQLTDDDNIAQTATQTFDVSVWQFICPLIVGGRTIILNDGDAWEPGLLFENLKAHKVTIYESVPAHFAILLDYLENVDVVPVFPALRNLMMNGEALPTLYCKRWFALYPEIEMSNVYGPTECSDDVTHFIFNNVSDSWEANVPIGKPIRNVTIYILNADMQLCPPGCNGEIFVSGIALGRGYINTDSAAFVDDHIRGIGKMYRTGDYGLLNYDSLIEYKGRIDNQVKIRGNRIEIGEIEEKIRLYPSVKDTAVIATEINSVKRLIGFVVQDGEIEVQDLKLYLKAILPDYMVPEQIIEIDEIPLNSNGKVDRQQLAKYPIERTATSYSPPVNDTEAILTRIWERLLKAEQVGTDDNFFELGGDSIVAIQMVGQAKEFGIYIKPRNVFMYQTIRELAIVQQSESHEEAITEQGILKGSVALSPIQHHYLEEIYSEASYFNLSLLLTAGKTLQSDTLERIFGFIVNHHDALRMNFSFLDGKWIQEYGEIHDFFSVVQVSSDDASNGITEVCKAYQSRISLLDNILFKVVHINTGETESCNRILIVGHHLICDAVFLRVLVNDLNKLYMQYLTGAELSLGKKQSSYRNYVNTLAELAAMKNTVSDLPYWSGILNNDFSRGGNSERVLVRDTMELAITLSHELTEQLLTNTCTSFNVTVHELLLASLVKTMGELYGVSHLTVGIELHGRDIGGELLDVSETAGWFTNLFPVMFTVTDTGDIDGTVRSTKEIYRTVPGKGASYGMLRYLNNDMDIRNRLSHIKLDVLFNYLGQVHNTDENAEFQFAKESSGNNVSGNSFFNESLIINSIVIDRQLYVSFRFPAEETNTLIGEGLASRYAENLEILSTHAVECQFQESTPDAFGLAEDITAKEFMEFLEDGDDILQF